MTAKTHYVMESPVGPLTLVHTEGALSGVYMSQYRHGPRTGEFGERVCGGFEQEESELREYFERQRTKFTIPLWMEGTSFQRAVWELLREIPFGETRSYAQIAEAMGNPRSVRAVGLANGHNPISIVIPCHRVIGSDGSLTGYGGGLERKKFLLELEGALPVSQLHLI